MRAQAASGPWSWQRQAGGAGTGVRAVRIAVRRLGAYPGVMTVTVHLDGGLAAALEAEAARRGQSPDQVAADLLAERLPHAGGQPRRTLAFAAAGASTTGRHAAGADDILAEGFGRDE